MESAHLVFGATSWSFPAMNVWVEVTRGRMACGGGVRTSDVGQIMHNAVGCLVRSRMLRLLMCLPLYPMIY